MAYLKRLFRELNDLTTRGGQQGFLDVCIVDNEDPLTWRAILMGREGSPYENGEFIIDIAFTKDYPFKPPKLRFSTRIFHPNVDSDGRLCSCSTCRAGSILHDKWSPAKRITDVSIIKYDDNSKYYYFCIS